MEENCTSLFRFADYLDECKTRSLTAVDYCTLFNVTNLNYHNNQYYDATYCGKRFAKSRNRPHLLFAEPDINGVVVKSVFPVDAQTKEAHKEEQNEESPVKDQDIDVGNVKSLSDLIAIVESFPVAEEGVRYNIDLASLIRVKAELRELDQMIGMESVKTAIMDQLIYFLQRLHQNGEQGGQIDSDFKHTVIYGPPGTGKTEVAKLIGRLYSKLGILGGQVFKKATRHDMVAGYLGQTAIKTKALIKECLGGVLFIDEAYSLGSGDRLDSFSKECIDTLCESLSEHKNDLMVIVAGYQTELEDQFFSANPGLESRFIWRFYIESYSSAELLAIFRKKTAEIGWTVDAADTALEPWFEKNRKEFKSFGRDMEVLLFYVKIAHSKRVFGKSRDEPKRRQITISDLAEGLRVYLKNRKMKDRKPDENTRRILESMYV